MWANITVGVTVLGSGGGTRSRVDAVRLGMVDGKDRELLAEWFATFPEYDVDVFDADDPYPTDYDICLLDATTLAAVRDSLAARDESADPVYLPHVLLAQSRDQGGGSANHGDPAADSLVDDVFGLPMAKTRLRQRIENLLQTRRASRRLAEREEQYRELVALTPESILLVDDGTIVYANDAASDLLDVPDADSLTGRDLDEFVADADLDVLVDLMTSIESAANVPVGYVDVGFRSATGSTIDAAVTGVTVTYEGRRVVQLVVRDLTEQRQRERRLDLFGRAIEAADQGITIADARQDDTPLIYTNDGFERITGYPLDEVLGRNSRFLQGDNTNEDTVATLRRAVDAGDPASVDILNYRRDGTAFWNRLDIVPIEDEDGTVTHFLGFQRDVTERKQREQRLSVMNRVLRHNLRNKLSLVLGYADAIEAGDASPTEATAEIRAAANDLLEISDQVREFDSVLSANREDHEPFDVVSLVDRAVAALTADYPAARLDISAPDEAVVTGHPALPDVLSDLLRLLGDTDTADGPDASVDVFVTEDRVHVAVTDRSNAFSSDDLAVVQRDTETPLEHLQGVNLWLLRWAVEQSHGEITVDTGPDTSTIHLEFVQAAPN